MSSGDRPVISPSAIGQFFKLQQCPMYLHQRYVEEDFAGISDLRLSPLLAATGEQFESDQLQHLLAADIYSVGIADSSFEFDERWVGDVEADQERLATLLEQLAEGERDRPIVFYQPSVRGTIGAWPVRGDADIVIATANDGASTPRPVDIRIVELKSSSSVSTHHQLQAAIYSLLFESVHPAIETTVTASVVSQDPEKPDLSALLAPGGTLDPRRLDSFDLSTRRNDINLLLEPGGALDSVLRPDGSLREPGDAPDYRIDARCDNCSKQAKCITHAVSNHDLSLLGLTEGVQASLREVGVESLHDLATLYEWPVDGDERRATSHSKPRPADPELVTRIMRETELSNLLDIAQIAHRFLRQIDPEFDEQWDRRTGDAGPWSDYLIGTGRNLPDDDPPGSFDLAYPRRSLVRIYPYVQYDFVRDRVVYLAAKVTCSRQDGDDAGQFVASEPEGLPTDSETAKDREERRLIRTFFERLSDAIGAVRPDLTGEGFAATDGFLHIYPYGEAQRQALVDAVKRHPKCEEAQAFRTLLGYREDIDQEVVSVLRSEFRERHALRYPGLGIVQTVAQFYSNASEFSWEAPRSQGETPLKQVFDVDFFETSVPYTEAGDRIILNFEQGLCVPPDRMSGYYPVVGRHQDALPLEYLYASAEFDFLHPELADSEDIRSRIIRYRHHGDESSARVGLGDIADGIQAICNAYEHIERSIRDKDATIIKEPLDLEDLRENTLGVSELQSTCLEYQELEFGSKRRDLESRFRNPLSQRVAAGQAIPFEVTTPPIESDEDHEGRSWVEGSLLRSLGNGTDDGIQPGTPLSLEPGSFVVMTPLESGDEGTLTEAVDSPRKIANQVLGRLTLVDTTTGRVRISFNRSSHQPREKFKPNHVGWTSQRDDEWNRQYVDEGMTFVLDSALDDFTAHRAHFALQNAAENDVHNRLVNLYEEELDAALQLETPQFDPQRIREFVETFDEVMPFSTNTDQESFITRITHSVAALQGPPGTGKTEYASAPALLARAYSSTGDRFNAVASGHSNTAVDELASAVGSAQSRLTEEGVLENAELVRIRSDDPTGNLPENVREYQYYEDRDDIETLFDRHLLATESPGPLVVFATPVTLRNAVHGIRDLIADEAESAEELMATGDARLFDFLLVDEASMMDLPLLFLAGAFLGRDKQLMLVGDHRQMQPIQSHDWEAEDRQTLEENTPAVSALDFIRFLRGDEDSNFEQFDREPPKWPDKEAVLPVDRLRTTYRLPPAMARFETELFYYKDNITLESGAPGRMIPDVRDDSLPDWLNAALEPESRVTVLVHDEKTATKDSPLEAYLAEELLDQLPTVGESAGPEELTAGVVVPFRLMRRRLQDSIEPTVDTVERFQGGERDVMVLAMTAGNQGYVNQLAEFLLDANRFNVGASRMKRKLFIVVSKSLFSAVSGDPRKYEQQKAWKQLYQRMVAGQRPAASADISSREVEELEDRHVTVDIYTGFED